MPKSELLPYSHDIMRQVKHSSPNFSTVFPGESQEGEGGRGEERIRRREQVCEPSEKSWNRYEENAANQEGTNAGVKGKYAKGRVICYKGKNAGRKRARKAYIRQRELWWNVV